MRVTVCLAVILFVIFTTKLTHAKQAATPIDANGNEARQSHGVLRQ